MTIPEFGEQVAPAHTHLDVSDEGTLYIVGDVHGCIDELRSLWEKLDPGRHDLVVFLGDLIRKGPASERVVTFVRTRPNAISLLGNNEAMVIRGEASAGLSSASRDAIESFPLVVSWDDSIAVHGGVHPDRPLEQQTPTDLLEMRSLSAENGYDGPFWFDSYEGPPRIFFGHTVLADPLVEQWAVGLDTGCVHGGRLTAYNCARGRVVDVPAEQTYAFRSSERILHP